MFGVVSKWEIGDLEEYEGFRLDLDLFIDFFEFSFFIYYAFLGVLTGLDENDLVLNF